MKDLSLPNATMSSTQNISSGENGFLLFCVLSTWWLILNSFVYRKAVKKQKQEKHHRWVLLLWWVSQVILTVSDGLAIAGLSRYGRWCDAEKERCEKLADVNLVVFLVLVGWLGLLVGYGICLLCLHEEKQEQEQEKQEKQEMTSRVEVVVV